jgi:hypothetical protein
VGKVNSRKLAQFRADVAARRTVVLHRRGAPSPKVLRADSAPLSLSPSQKAKLEKLGWAFLAELRDRSDAGWEDVPRGKGGQWTTAHGLPAGMNAAHKAHHSKLVAGGKHEAAAAYRGKFAKASAPATQPTPAAAPHEPLAPAAHEPPAPVASAAAPGSLAALSRVSVPSPDALTFEQSGKDMGGAGEKDVYKDATGQRWLFKAATVKGTNEPKPYAVHAQVAFAEVVHEVKDHVPVAAATINGKLGTLQPILSLGSPSNLAQVEPSKLTEREKLDVAQEHVLDWVMSQHDTHGGNLLRTSDGRVVGIDKEQGYRYFGKDKLDVHYQPNTEIYGEKPPYYNQFWKGVGDGSVKWNPHELAPTIAKVEAIPSERFASLVRPYAESIGKGEAFVKAAVARKESIRGDFEKLIGGVQGKPFKFAHQDGAREDWNEEEFLRIPAGQPGGGQFQGGLHHEQNPLPKLTPGVKAALTKKGNAAEAATLAKLTSPDIEKWKASLAENHELAAKTTDLHELEIWHQKVIPNAEAHLAKAIEAEQAKQAEQTPTNIHAQSSHGLTPKETGEERLPYVAAQAHLLQEQTSTAQAASGASKPSLDPETGKPWVLPANAPPPPPTQTAPAATEPEPEPEPEKAAPPAPHQNAGAKPSTMKAGHKAAYSKLIKAGKLEEASAYLKKFEGNATAPPEPSPASESPKAGGGTWKAKPLGLQRHKAQEQLGGENPNHADQEIKEKTTGPFEKWSKWLSGAMQHAMGSFKGIGFEWMNDHLRGGNVQDGKNADMLRALTEALNAAPETPRDFVVWRGFKYGKLAKDPASVLAGKSGILHDEGFSSHSLSIDKAIEFAGSDKTKAVLMRIRMPAGTRVRYWTSEHELLPNRDSRWQINKVYKTTDGYTVLDGEYLGASPVGLSKRGAKEDSLTRF